MDSALSFAASADDPASGGRHKVWGSKPLWVLPQTSTIASHLPKALRHRDGDREARRIGHACRFPTTASRSVRSATPSNHATAQTAFNAAAWTAYQKLPAPVLFVCEDNGIGISVKTPTAGSRAISATRRPRLFLRRWPRSRPPATNRCGAVAALPQHAPPDLPAPAHHAHHGPRRHRLRDRMASDSKN
jgi:hypothetical protein